MSIPFPPINTGAASVASNTRSIGDILVATGRLSAPNLQRILDAQAKDKLAFGDAALALKLLTKADIDFALSKQFNYAYLQEGGTTLGSDLVAAYKPFSPVGENLRAVRSQLMLRWFNDQPANRVLAVVSPGAQDGRSFIAANLAIVFAQQGQRTLLIDADLRAKTDRSQQALFKLGRSPGLSGILSDRGSLESAQAVPGIPSLTVLAAGAAAPNPQELLGRAGFGELLAQAAAQYDVVLIDTPAASQFSDAEIVASRAGAAIMVTRKNQSLLPAATGLARGFRDGGITLVGAVLNDA